MRRRLTPARLWPVFTHAVEQIADDLDKQKCHIDYANRRRRLIGWGMSRSDRKALFEGLPRLDRMRQHDPRIMSIIVWRDVTQAEAWYCPIVEAERAVGGQRRLTSSTSSLHEVDHSSTNRFRLRRRLRLYATQLGSACAQTGPLFADVGAAVQQETALPFTDQLRLMSQSCRSMTPE
ncbi:hypothetical protein ACF1GT_21805 [Streptomyces sp. NPDC014636]|uniref:hypothetical protein n=1 Tax=Streptomyces sp. NPDC014636 TaxID=3364876 RepID=UPI0036F9F93E